MGWVTFLWCATVAVGFLSLAAYGVQAGEGRPEVRHWPAELGPRPGEPTLVLFLHPACPCSRATLAEVDDILCDQTAPTDLRIVLFADERGEAFDARAELEASRIGRKHAGAAVLDPGGRIASRCGAVTSGTVLAFDADGHLCFFGGITPSRGHRGETDQHALLRDVRSWNSADLQISPVFGCSIASMQGDRP